MSKLSRRAATAAILVLISTGQMSRCRADLVAHFPLDGDAIDVVEGYEGIVPDSVTFVDAGVVGGAAEFEGLEGIVVDYDEALNPEDSFSVTAWVNAFDTASWNSVITSRSHEGNVISGYIIYNSPENAWDFWTGGGGAPGSWGRNIGPEAELEEWTHLAITYNRDDDEKILYVNGEEEAVVSGQNYEPNPNNPLMIGAGDDIGNDFFFTGLIDDVSIWDETLSQLTVQQLMTNGVAGGMGGGDLGDFNQDGMLDAADIDDLTAQVLAGANDVTYDVNGDGQVDASDRLHWIVELKNTWLGDANLDGEFSSGDLVTVFTAGQYEDSMDGNSTWNTGDWDGNGDFDSSDFVAALAQGGFEQGPRAAAVVVPEPITLGTCFTVCLGLLAVHATRKGSTNVAND